MRAILFWKDCWRFKPEQDAYWVECSEDEVNHIIPLLDDAQEWRDRRDIFHSSKFAHTNPQLGMQPDSYYFLISIDGKNAIPTPPYYPYAGQWNAYCPFSKIEPFSFKTL